MTIKMIKRMEEMSNIEVRNKEQQGNISQNKQRIKEKNPKGKERWLKECDNTML